MAAQRLVSVKKAKSFLRLFIIALALLYAFNVRAIAQMSSVHTTTTSLEDGIIGFPPAPQSGASTGRLQLALSSSDGCASIIFYYYAASSISWTAVIFWRKRQLERLVVLVTSAIIIFICMHFIHGDADCDAIVTSADYASNVLAKRVNPSTVWEYYSPEQSMDRNTRVSFRLHDPSVVPYPDKFAGVQGYRCDGLADLPASISGRGVLNFTTTVSTDLKVVFVGDSVSEQFAGAFDAAVLGPGYDHNRMAETYRNGHGNVNLHTCLSVTAPTRGGGVSAFWRMAHLMSMSTRAPSPHCEHKSTTWNEQSGWTLIDHEYSVDGKVLDHRYFLPLPFKREDMAEINLPYRVNAFDVVVLRLNHGWLTIEQLTRERVIEAITLTNMHLGAQTVIISTLNLNNNVRTHDDWVGIARINDMVRDIARKWVPPHSNSVRWILVQEFGNFTNQVVRINAEHIQLTNTTTPDFTQKDWQLLGNDFLLKRLSAESFWNPSIAMVCANKTFARANEKNGQVEDCLRNRISRDGAHWCVDTLGPRYSASIACLMGCIYNSVPIATNANDQKKVRQCERVCNERFMSLVPVDVSWVENDLELSSKLI